LKRWEKADAGIRKAAIISAPTSIQMPNAMEMEAAISQIPVGHHFFQRSVRVTNLWWR